MAKWRDVSDGNRMEDAAMAGDAAQELMTMVDSLQASWEEERAEYERKLKEAEQALAEAIENPNTDRWMVGAAADGRRACRRKHEHYHN
jgi:cellobiose-specific phosphotransferase system component IIA